MVLGNATVSFIFMSHLAQSFKKLCPEQRLSALPAFIPYPSQMPLSKILAGAVLGGTQTGPSLELSQWFRHVAEAALGKRPST